MGSVVGSVIGAGASLLGASRSRDAQRSAANAAQQAAQPFSVSGPFGSAIFNQGTRTLEGSLSPQLQQALQLSGQLGSGFGGQLTDFNTAGRQEMELGRLRELAAPVEAQARSRLQSQLFNRGRLGVGRGGGRTGALFNPETAALEEALAAADLQRVGQARDLARSEEQRLLGNFTGLTQQQQNLASLPIQNSFAGIQARTPASIAQLAAGPGLSQARTLEGFFSTLGGGIGQLGQQAFGGGGGQGGIFGAGPGLGGSIFGPTPNNPFALF